MFHNHSMMVPFAFSNTERAIASPYFIIFDWHGVAAIAECVKAAVQLKEALKQRVLQEGQKIS